MCWPKEKRIPANNMAKFTADRGEADGTRSLPSGCEST